MQLWYRLVELLPFDFAAPGQMLFMKNALLAVILISPIFGIVGTMIVNNKMAFFSDALGHGAFTGVAIGSIMGFFWPLWSAVAFSVFFSIVITLIKHKSNMSSDTIIGVFSSTAISLGVFIQTTGGRSISKAMTYFIGDILSITPDEIALLGIILVVVLLMWVLIFNKLLVSGINPSLAKSRGINVLLNELIFTTAIAVIVTVALPFIGLLVINSFLVLPAAASRNISTNQRQYHLLSVVIALLSGILGLMASYYIGAATGASIVLVSASIFFLSFIIPSYSRN